MAKERKSNFELLRILAMLAIVYGHFASHGNWVSASSAETIYLNIISVGGPFAVNVFVLITGYFTAPSVFRFRSLMKVLLPTAFWCLLIGFVFTVTFHSTTSITRILEIPWFVVAYTFMFLFIPWLNYIAQSISRQSYVYLLILGFYLLSLFSSITGSSFINSTVLWFIYLYLVGGFIAIHGINIRTRWLLFAALIVLALQILLLSLQSIYDNQPGVIISNGVFTSRNSVTVFILALIVILLIERVDVGYRPIINKIASASFEVYLISDNPFVRDWLWDNFASLATGNVLFLAIGGGIVAICIYAICTCLELVRLALAARISKSLPTTKYSEICNLIDSHYAYVVGRNDD